MKTGLALLLALGALLPRSAATPDANRVSAALSDMYLVIAGDLTAAARQMPSELYDFRPTPDVRSFGQIVGHVLGSQFIYCAQAQGAGIGTMDRDVLRRLGPIRTYAEGPSDAAMKPPSKETLVALLDEGVAFCKPAYGGMTDTSAAELIGKPGRESTRLQPLLENVAHNNLHYGNLVTYLRIKGLVPPSTERQHHAGE